MSENYLQLSAIQLFAVHGIHGVMGIAFVMELTETETFWLFGVMVLWHVHILDGAIALKRLPDILG